MIQQLGPRSPGRAPLRAVLVAAAALAFLLAGSAPAWAHAELIGSDPADGVLLPVAPATITLTFNEPVAVVDGGIRVLDAAGTPLPSTSQAIDNRVVITPQGLGTGTVIVSWRVISADSHPITGGLTFAVGQRSAATVAVPDPEPDLAVSVASAILQAIAYLGVLVAGGLIAFDVLVLRGQGEVRGALRRLSAGCAVGGVLAAFLLLPLTELRQRLDTLAGLADPAVWTSQLGRDAGLTLVLIGAGLLLAWEAAWAVNERTAASAAAALAGCGLAVGAFAVVGHTRGYGPVWLVLTADLVHLTVAAGWLGGLIGLGLLVRATGRTVTGRTVTGRAVTGRPGPARGPAATGTLTATRTLPRSRVEFAAVAVSRFSTMAAVLVAGLAVTGTLLAWRILGSWAALVRTGYGQALLVKLGLVVLVVAAAGYNRFRVRPAIAAAPTAQAGWVRLRRSMTVEAGLLVAVLAVTGWLVSASPTLPTDPSPGSPAGGAGSAATTGSPVEQAVPLGSGEIRTRLTPATVGVNSLEFTVVDANGQPVQPVSDPQVSVTMPAAGVGPLTRPVSVTGPGAYQAVLDLPLSGQWTIAISVRTSEFEQPTARIEVSIP